MLAKLTAWRVALLALALVTGVFYLLMPATPSLHLQLLPTGPKTLVEDPHALPWTRLTSIFNNYYQQMQTHERSRPQQILHNATSLATYAWAITRPRAQQLLEELSQSRAQQFDIAIHVKCKAGEQRCLIPVPELMHHHKAIGEVDIDSQGNGSVVRKDLEWWRGVHKYTYNVEWSARCNAAGVGEKLAEGWQCVPGKYDDVI